MSNLIRKGNHYDNKLFSSWPFIGKTSMTRYVRFHDSWRYTLPSPHQRDINKLFGVSFGFFALHENSARFGAYYEPADDSVVLVPYCYVNGQRNWNEFLEFPEIARVKIGDKLWCRISVTHEPEYRQPIYEFEVDAPNQPWRSKAVVRPENLPSYGATHGMYFGGPNPAPHDILTDISKHPLR